MKYIFFKVNTYEVLVDIRYFNLMAIYLRIDKGRLKLVEDISQGDLYPCIKHNIEKYPVTI